MKYYTPTKDEFFNGFEFEAEIDGKFENATYVDELKDVHIKKSRVKYLDIDDLLSLGFTIKREFDGVTHLYKNIHSNQPLYYLLEYNLENDLPYISLTDMHHNTLLGKIHIKNKNELKWLLNRYGIL